MATTPPPELLITSAAKFRWLRACWDRNREKWEKMDSLVNEWTLMELALDASVVIVTGDSSPTNDSGAIVYRSRGLDLIDDVRGWQVAHRLSRIWEMATGDPSVMMALSSADLEQHPTDPMMQPWSPEVSAVLLPRVRRRRRVCVLCHAMMTTTPVNDVSYYLPHHPFRCATRASKKSNGATHGTSVSSVLTKRIRHSIRRPIN